MDARHFDQLARSVSSVAPRRGLLALLAALPLLGGLLALLDPDEAAARKNRRKTRKKPHKRASRRRKKRKQRKKQQKCKAHSRARTCANRCGTVKNNCKKKIDCGSCVCEGGCDICETCNERTGVCEPDPSQQGDACGAPGQVCQADGACACDDTSCANGQRCQGAVCVCDSSSCSGCCDETGACQPGTAQGACGTGGEACVPCTGDDTCGGSGTPGDCGCTPTTCAEAGATCGTINDGCGGTVECGTCSGSAPVCFEGACVCGDVCANGCQFTSLQAAIDALLEDTTIRLCAETYGGAFDIRKTLSVRGVGEGPDGTILNGLQNGPTVFVAGGATVALDDLRVTGGSIGGVAVSDGTVTMTNCTITENTDRVGGGGLYTPNENSTAILTNCTISHNTVGVAGGGIYNPDGSVTLNDTIITENEAGVGGGGIRNIRGTVVFNGTSIVCGNRPDQCAGDGYTNPNCPDLCPSP